MGKRRSRNLPHYTLRHEDACRWVIVCRREFTSESVTIPADEALWATGDWQRQSRLFWWYRNNGLARQEPHPMGKPLEPLWAARLATIQPTSGTPHE
jgi:hypothetical protein